MSEIIYMASQILFYFFMLGLSLTLSFWQTGIMFQFDLMNLTNIFDGLSDFFLNLYSSRDIWYNIIKFLTEGV